MMLRLLLKSIFLYFVLTNIKLQFCHAQGDAEQHSTTLTRENVEALLRVLSDTCRAEMESALNTQSDITVECKGEIQEALMKLNIPLGQQPPPQEQSSNTGKQKRRETEKLSEDGVAKDPIISPIYSIIGFIVIFFGAITSFVVYVSKQRADYITKKPKKISKKKVNNEQYSLVLIHHL